VRLLGAWIEGPGGEHLDSIEHGTEIRLRAELETTSDMPGVVVGFLVANADGVGVAEFTVPVGDPLDPTPLRARTRVRIDAELENPLSAGRYFVHCGINRVGGGVSLHVTNAVDFVVYGGLLTHGIVIVPHTAEAIVEQEPGLR
jgi:hypothetical protein